MVNTIYTQEELKLQLKELKSRRESVYGQRKNVLEKFSQKQSNTQPAEDLHRIELKIEDLERKMSILF